MRPDRVAGQVMRMPAPDAVTISSRPQVSRKCGECEEELQRKETGRQTMAGEAPTSVHETLHSTGQPLDMESRAFFESRFGTDLSQVRIHADPRAAESAHSVYGPYCPPQTLARPEMARVATAYPAEFLFSGEQLVKLSQYASAETHTCLHAARERSVLQSRFSGMWPRCRSA